MTYHKIPLLIGGNYILPELLMMIINSRETYQPSIIRWDKKSFNGSDMFFPLVDSWRAPMCRLDFS